MFRKFSPALLFVAGVAVTLGAFGIMQLAPSASASATDTIVGINPGVEPYQLTVLPSNGVQPAYGVFVTQACRATLHVGDSWPSAAAVCR